MYEEMEVLAIMTLSFPVSDWLNILQEEWKKDERIQQLIKEIIAEPILHSKFTLTNNQLKYKMRLWLGDQSKLKAKILQKAYGGVEDSHSGTKENLRKDFIKGLLKSHGREVIFVVVDRLSKDGSRLLEVMKAAACLFLSVGRQELLLEFSLEGKADLGRVVSNYHGLKVSLQVEDEVFHFHAIAGAAESGWLRDLDSDHNVCVDGSITGG
ncbi:hypothetical protein EZV62_001330 [Acer yangbiense]|uniref:Uncharacterized protein n=1 Tax=Acer yangbiense TaxID=1000413 RepID=A0A5C7ITZ0_9ROSI|nr:hypothetical protein EZV62_001330 [Acer yangbiense]